MERIVFLDRLENDQEIPTPLPLTSFDDWVAWLESLLAWARHMRSARTGTPFLYLLRDHQDVTPDMLTTAYDSIDEELISTVILAGPNYEHDNCLLFDHLHGWLGEGPAWPFMQLHARTMNGRAAFFAVKAQADGGTGSSDVQACQGVGLCVHPNHLIHWSLPFLIRRLHPSSPKGAQ
jgi:hypothetical protein